MTIQRRDIPGLPHAALRVAAVFVIASLPLAGGCDQRAGAPDPNTAIPPSPAIHQEKPREIPPQEAQPMTNPPTSPASAQDDAYQEALHDAAGTDPARHAALRARLTDPAFLGQLDTAADYQAPARTLRIAGVLKELIDNRTPVSDETLNTLASNAEFVSVYARQDLTIRAMAYVRPASKEAVELWKVHSTPKAPYKHVAAAAMADNGTPPALELLETVLTNTAHQEQDRVSWMQDPVLVHRTEPDMLLMCERMVTNSLEPNLRPKLVAALFDYREEWYLACDPPICPNLATAPQDAKLTLRRIGEFALANVILDDPTKSAVESTLAILPRP